MIKKLYNPEASAANAVVIAQSDSGCCGAALTDCRYVATWLLGGDTMVNLKMLDSAGVEQTLDLSGVAETEAAILAAITGFVEANGYTLEDGGITVVVVADTTATATMTGQAVFTTNADTDDEYDITPLCTKGTTCNYYFETDGNGTELVPVAKNGTDGTVAKFTIGDSAATVKGLIEGFFTGSTVTVVKNTVAGVFEITVTGNATDVLYIDGAEGLKCCCVPSYS